MPDDDIEFDRLSRQHFEYKKFWGKNYLGVENFGNPKKILDMGTGSGIWAYEVAQEYPDAEVIGVDLAPIKLRGPNLSYQELNLTDAKWPFEPSSFDVVHGRFISNFMPNFRECVRKATEILKPGGILLFVEMDTEYYDDGRDNVVLDRVHKAFKNFMGKVGVDVTIARDLENILQESGDFTSVKSIKQTIPIGPWHSDPKLKDLGAWYRDNIVESMKASALKPELMGLEDDIKEKTVWELEGNINEGEKERNVYYNAYYLAAIKK